MADVYLDGVPYSAATLNTLGDVTIVGDIDVSGSAQFGAGGLTQIGDAGATSHSMAADDLFCSADLEVDGTLYSDGHIVLNNNFSISYDLSDYGGIIFRKTSQTIDCPMFVTGTVPNYILICENADIGFDFAHAQQTNPTLFIHSPNQSTTEWISFAHNQTDMVNGIGSGSKVVHHEAPVSVADDGEFGLPNASIGTGWFMSEDGDFLEISWTAAGVVTELNSSGNTAITDSDTNLCAYDDGTQVKIKNRLGDAKEIMFEYHYNTP